nr:hypothetical protein [Tanacetum cinerariifolium]
MHYLNCTILIKIITSYGDVVTLKRGKDDQDKDKDPSTGSNQGSKRRRSGKEAESLKEPTHKESKSTSSSKGASRSQPKSSRKSAYTKEHGQKVDDLEDQTHQEFNTGNDDVIHVREVLDNDERQKATGKEFSNPFMAGVNTPRSDEDRLKLIELMVLLLQKRVCVHIRITAARLSSYSCQANRVENLENDNATQKLVIVQLKARVKKLEKAIKIKSSKIELVKDADIAESEGRNAAEHAEKQAEIYNLDLDHSSKVLSMQEDDSEVQEVVEVVTTAKLITEVVTAAASQVSAASITIHAASTNIPAAKPSIPAGAPTVVAAYTRRRKGVIIRDPEEELPLKTPAETPKVKDKGKGILVKTPKPMKKKDQIEMDGEYARKLEEMEEEDQEIIKSINETPTQKAAKRKKLSEEAQEAEDLRKRLEVLKDEDDDVFVEATPLA